MSSKSKKGVLESLMTSTLAFNVGKKRRESGLDSIVTVNSYCFNF